MQISQTINGFCITLLADGYSPITVKVYRQRLHRLSAFLRDKHIDTITPDDMRSFYVELHKTVSSSSVQAYWKTMRSFFRWAETEFQCKRPDADIPAPRFQHSVVVPFTHDEVAKMLRAAKTKRDKTILLLLLDTGLRVSEACRLNVADVDLETGTVQVRPWQSSAKSRPRVVYIGKAARKAIWYYLSSRPDVDANAPLISTNVGHPLDSYQVAKILTRIATRAGVSKTHPHRFRHTFAIEFLRNGGNIFELQRLLGHASLQMVRMYLDLSDSDTAEAHKRASPADNWRL